MGLWLSYGVRGSHWNLGYYVSSSCREYNHRPRSEIMKPSQPARLSFVWAWTITPQPPSEIPSCRPLISP